MSFLRFLSPSPASRSSAAASALSGVALAALAFVACGDSGDTTDDDTSSGSAVTTGTASTTSSSASSSASGAGGGEAELPDACAKTSRYLTSDGFEVTQCDELHAERPFVRLPQGKIDGQVYTYYGAYDPGAGLVLTTGETFVLLDEAGQQRFFSDPTAPWASKLHLPSSRVLVYLYEWHGTPDVVTIDGQTRSALRYVDARPIVYVPSSVMDGSLLGAWEGKIAGRLPQPMGIFNYGLDRGATIRVEYTALTPDPMGLTEWDVQGQSFPEGGKAVVIGQIVNMTSAVRGADGACIPALSQNADIPFEDATDGRLDLQRIAAMHAPGDMVLAHEYPTGSSWAGGGGMSNIGPAHPAALIQDQARPAWTDYSAFPHGTPDGMQIDIHRVTGGGGACQ